MNSGPDRGIPSQKLHPKIVVNLPKQGRSREPRIDTLKPTQSCPKIRKIRLISAIFRTQKVGGRVPKTGIRICPFIPCNLLFIWELVMGIQTEKNRVMKQVSLVVVAFLLPLVLSC